MWVSTFHSACLRMLRPNGDRLGYRSSFTVYDDTDSRRLIEMITSELGFDQKRLPSRAVQGVISQAKSELVDFETFGPRRGAGPTRSASGSPRCTRSTSSGCTRPTPWTSTTC